ncbi:MAG: hypothetical protein M3290_05610 [Actinomycetota bacterium]|nr:hypothetical protein [Actinomycetota bacterium]
MKALVIAAVVIAGLGTGCAAQTAGVVDQSNKASMVQMTATLQSAGVAEDDYYGLNNTYTSDVGALMADGLNIPREVKLTIPYADPSGYCLEAGGGVTSSSTWHMKSEQQVPIPGGCG